MTTNVRLFAVFRLVNRVIAHSFGPKSHGFTTDFDDVFLVHVSGLCRFQFGHCGLFSLVLGLTFNFNFGRLAVFTSEYRRLVLFCNFWYCLHLYTGK